MVRILAISGSLRAGSSNSALVQAAAIVAPAGTEVTIYNGLADLPPFNPDRESDDSLTSVLEFRSRLKNSDAVLISSPEYAHGVPGTLKNALDWLVGSGEFVDKPVALMNASPWATYAYASLTETLKTMSANVVSSASITMPVAVKNMSGVEIAADPVLSNPLKSALKALAASAVQRGVE